MTYFFNRLKEGSTWLSFLIAAVLAGSAVFVTNEGVRTVMVLLAVAIAVGGFFYAKEVKAPSNGSNKTPR